MHAAPEFRCILVQQIPKLMCDKPFNDCTSTWYHLPNKSIGVFDYKFVITSGNARAKFDSTLF